MNGLTTGVNWPAVVLGTVLAFGLGMLWFSPKMFGKIWARGSHNLRPPEMMPYEAMALQLVGTFLMAWIIGVTAVANQLAMAILVIVTISVLQMSMGRFGQKSMSAAVVDGGFIAAMGALMILAQGIL